MENLAVTATINLRGLRAGQTALVDPRDPYVSELLSAGFLIPEWPEVAPEEPPAEPGLDEPPSEAEAPSLPAP